MQDSQFPDIVARITESDPRFDKKAYDFVRLGLDHTVKDIRKRDAARAEKLRHVTGAELLGGLRVYALDQFGPMAKSILNAWGIKTSRDFGAIVFNLIDHKVFSKTESDRIEDFEGVFDFDDAFVAPFLPSGRGRPKSRSIGRA